MIPPSGTDPEPVEEPPYFFLSYAHTPAHNGKLDPDTWVWKLYRDLCEDVIALTNWSEGEPGFIDHQLLAGQNWSDRLSRALATCRVFVPLYSPRYFESDQCGKEWAAFARRMGRAELIVPALWVPVESDALPVVAQKIHFAHPQLGHRYRERGFYGIIKVRRYRSDYEEAVYELASMIVKAAKRSTLAPARPEKYDTLDSAFGFPRGQRTGRRRVLRITVVAPDIAHLPPGRSPATYGMSPLDWNPYAPDCAHPIATLVADLVRDLGYQVNLGTWDDHRAALMTEETPTEPGLLIVDPWSTLVRETQEALRQFDALDRPWISPMISLNPDDEQTLAAESRLRAGLTRALQDKIMEGRATSKTAVTGIPSLERFNVILPRMAETATRQFFSHAPAYPPVGPTIERPRLGGPTATTEEEDRDE